MRARGLLYNRMIPKSGYRFSEKIMRKRHSKNSAEHHRVTPEPAVGPAFGSIMRGVRVGFVSLDLPCKLRQP